MPARAVAVYAPGLFPMDFHAVAEAVVDGHWQVVDATLLAPRSCLVRIATGRDAADTAFLSITVARCACTAPRCVPWCRAICPVTTWPHWCACPSASQSENVSLPENVTRLSSR